MNFCTITLKYKFLILILVGVFILKNTNAQESVFDSLMTVAENDISSNPLSAIPVLQQAHRLAIQDDSFDDICNSTISLGLAYSTTGKYRESITLIDTFLLTYKDMLPDDVLIKLYNNLGGIYYDLDSYEVCKYYYMELYELAKNEKNSIGMSQIHFNISNILYKLNNDELAYSHLQRAYQIIKENQDTVALVHVLGSYGDLNTSHKNYDSASYYYHQSLIYSRLKKMIHEETSNLIRLGKLAFYQDNLILAEGYYQQALRNPEINKIPQIEVALMRSEILQKNGSFEEALKLLQNAKTLAEEIPKLSLQVELTKKLADMQLLNGNLPLAYKNLENYITLKDSLDRRNHSNKVFSNEFQMNLENRQAIKSKDQIIRIQFYILSGLILLVIMVVFYFIHRRQKLTIKNKELIIELNSKKETELKNDLGKKNAALTEKMLMLNSNEKLNHELINLLEKIEFNTLEDTAKKIQSIISEIKQANTNSFWDEFQVYFTMVNPNFYENLAKNFPRLTPNERKLSAFIKLNLSTKEIMNITRQSQNSIKVARVRLRKKLDIQNEKKSIIEVLSHY